tara:strand:- start:39 stop:554 length:516 start_codon:yes stop_codon:yes gene_type:complete
MNLIDNLLKIKKSLLKKENIYYLALIFFIFFLDRYSKYKIINNIDNNSLYLNDYINLDLIWNTGIGFGLFSSNSSLIYNLISIIIGIIILILIFVLINSEKLDRIIFSIIIGGAIGNYYDRIIFNAVPDFIDIHYGNFHWFTFNIADIFITIGIIIFIIKGFFIKNENEKI